MRAFTTTTTGEPMASRTSAAKRRGKQDRPAAPLVDAAARATAVARRAGLVAAVEAAKETLDTSSAALDAAKSEHAAASVNLAAKRAELVQDETDDDDSDVVEEVAASAVAEAAAEAAQAAARSVTFSRAAAAAVYQLQATIAQAKLSFPAARRGRGQKRNAGNR